MASSKNNRICVMVSLVRANACKVELGLDLCQARSSCCFFLFAGVVYLVL